MSTKNETLYFSEFIGRKIYHHNGKYISKVSDIFVDFQEIYPSAIAIQFIKNGHYFYADWSQIKFITNKSVELVDNPNLGRSRTFPIIKRSKNKTVKSILSHQFIGETIEYPPIGKVILDKQIVDTFGKKVVRVNDINLLKINNEIKVTHASIGTRSLLRRIGLLGFITFLKNIFFPKSKKLENDTLISWQFVHAVPDKNLNKNVKLTLTDDEIKKLHPADIADIIEELDNNARNLLFKELDHELAAETLTEINQEFKTSIIKDERPEDIAEILEFMGPDEAVDILNDFDKDTANQIIEKISDKDTQEDIIELLEYDEHTAGGIMSNEVFEITPNLNKQDILKIIQNEYDEIESIYDIYIIDNDKQLIGQCPLNKLLIQKENVTIGEIMEREDIKYLTPKVHWKEVAELMSKYNLINLPIINPINMELLGVVSVDDVLPWLLDER
jgi:magnesium transporter